MIQQVRELYDYDEVRAGVDATLTVVHPARAVLVLGSTQTTDLLDAAALGELALRRRRGGGGLVLLHPDDVWVDWWIPASDERWRADVHESSQMVGQWWAEVLRDVVSGAVTVHDGALEGDPAFRLVCFAGRGPGEVFVDGRKAVGVTQWRVREGIFVSTVLPAHDSNEVLRYLREAPEGLNHALDHHVLSSLGVVDPTTLVEGLRRASGSWQCRATSPYV